MKFEAGTQSLAKIGKEVDKIKAEVFRYLITKTVSDDEATNKYQEDLEGEELTEASAKEAVEKEIAKGDAIDTTSTDSKDSEEVVAETSSNDIPDDLTKVEGIGPKIQETLYEAGVKTFAQLAAKTAVEVSEIITDVRGSHDATT